ncbi:MAG TPA: universal stress protein [Kofleriaceae bacterium]|nr:universal stress protein [Kofleriaceae bacterium]
MIWKTILVPHDFSSSANHAAAIARDEAKLHGAKLLLLHVVELPQAVRPDSVIVPDENGAPIDVRTFATSAAERHLEDIVQRLRKDGVTATFDVKLGHPVDEINKFVDDQRVDLVVMGTHGRTGFAHLLVGSVTERVVRTCKVPVLTVRAPEHS